MSIINAHQTLVSQCTEVLLCMQAENDRRLTVSHRVDPLYLWFELWFEGSDRANSIGIAKLTKMHKNN